MTTLKQLLRFQVSGRRIKTALAALAIAVGMNARGADPMSTDYTFLECFGSAMPYEAPASVAAAPDSLTPVFINHVGRHGARYPSSARHSSGILALLDKADSLGTITPRGRELRELAATVGRLSKGRWGALDSLGTAEQWGIAARMQKAYPELFKGRRVEAVASYVPRCVMSMYSFLHQITRLDNHVEITARSGREFSWMLRFFDVDNDYRDYVKGESWRDAYTSVADAVMPVGPLERVLGKDFPFGEIDFQNAAMEMYQTVSGTAAMGLECDPSRYFTREEINSLWQCFNLRQYLLHSASTMSSLPAEIASPLLQNLVETTDRAISDHATKGDKGVSLRFGHAETLMPLFALMKIPGCFYLTNYFDSVGRNWRDFYMVPMAANLQIIVFVADSGRYYVRFDLNERPVALDPDAGLTEYVEWGRARAWLERRIPLYYQAD